MTFTDTTKQGYHPDRMLKDNEMEVPISGLGCDYIGCKNWPWHWMDDMDLQGFHIKNVILCDEHYRSFKTKFPNYDLSEKQKQILEQRHRWLFSEQERFRDEERQQSLRSWKKQHG